MTPNQKVKHHVELQKSYRRLFLGDGGELHHNSTMVLADLKKFCRATESCAVKPVGHPVFDPIASAICEGRREVWLRIMHHLHMDIDDRTLIQLHETLPYAYD